MVIVGRKVSVSNERESNESMMKRDAIEKKADAPKKRVVKERVPSKKGSKGSKGKGEKSETREAPFQRSTLIHKHSALDSFLEPLAQLCLIQAIVTEFLVCFFLSSPMG
jgi:hypothetical protein